MKRIHLFEFEDLPWFPHWLRQCMTRYIVAMHRLLGTRTMLANLIERALKHTNATHIIDLCSGSGGPMLDVAETLRNQHNLPDLKLTLSDLYPNQEAAAQLKQQGDPNTTYLTTPINAADLDPEWPGVRTLVCSMHHMRPQTAHDILKNAQEAHQPICVFEISDNSVPTQLWWLALPMGFLMTFLITPLVRPMTWRQLVFTYLIPILPALIAWDGSVSNVRTYTLDDMDILLEGLKTDQYRWEKGSIKGKGGPKLYLLGLPQNSKPDATPPSFKQKETMA
uniref:Class I SAM-dependent methyltransferase n=1 Tax=Roseihalotalea indica TaxID=2867963 RepID=A0AA49GTP3_9BACT|nr:hypothetical protein K4G66_02170 [Tunicatimonas sp. TK19036]